MRIESCTPHGRAAIATTDRTGSVFAISWQRILAEAKLYWPRHTAKKLSKITGASVRTCYRWFTPAGPKPDAREIILIMDELRAEYVARGKIFEQFELQL